MIRSPALRTAAGPATTDIKPNRPLMGFLWAAVSVAIFAGWFVVTRFSVTHELRVWDVTALRFGVGAVLLSPVLLTSCRKLPARAWLDGFVFSILWGSPFVLLIALGLQLTSASEASSIAPALMPIFAGAIGWLVLRERPGVWRLSGYAAIAAGLVVLVGDDAAMHGRPDATGIVALAAASAMWAGYTVRFRYSSLTGIQAAAMICFWATVVYLPIYLAFGLSRLGEAPPREVMFQIVYQGGLMSGVAVVTFNRAITLLGSRAAAAIIALVPVSATALAIPVLGEIPTMPGIAAIILIAAGVVLAARPAPAPAGREFPDTPISTGRNVP